MLCCLFTLVHVYLPTHGQRDAIWDPGPRQGPTADPLGTDGLRGSVHRLSEVSYHHPYYSVRVLRLKMCSFILSVPLICPSGIQHTTSPKAFDICSSGPWAKVSDADSCGVCLQGEPDLETVSQSLRSFVVLSLLPYREDISVCYSEEWASLFCFHWNKMKPGFITF